MLPFALTRTKARRTSLVLAAAAYAAEFGLAAAEPSQPIASANLEVNADPRCTTRADLIARVRARSPRVRFVDDGSGLAIRVQISPTPSGGVAGDVTLSSPETKPSVRHVPAHSCTEAADAVALIIAVTLDPTSADTRQNASTAELAAARAASTASPTNEDAVSRNTPPASALKRNSPQLIAVPANANELSAQAPSQSRPSFGGQLAAEALMGVAPGIMPAVALFAVAGLDRPSVWSPAAMLGIHHAWRTDVQEQGGLASFTLDAATLDACPLRFRLGVIEARPCGALLFGRFSTRGTDTLNPAAESARPFWVVGGAAVITAKLAWRLELSGRLAVGANLLRDSFEFSPATFYTVPLVSAAGSLGLGLHWP